MTKTVNIYTDGACSGNQNDENVGGWGCVLEFAGIEKELCGGECNTTNNRMELFALISALSALKEKELQLNIYSDSSYVINCFKNGWHLSWQKNGWKNSKKQPVENQDLWQQLLGLMEGQQCRFFLVKGHIKTPTEADFARFTKHNGDGFTFERFAQIVDYNNRCDALANVYINEHRLSAINE